MWCNCVSAMQTSIRHCNKICTIFHLDKWHTQTNNLFFYLCTKKIFHMCERYVRMSKCEFASVLVVNVPLLPHLSLFTYTLSQHRRQTSSAYNHQELNACKQIVDCNSLEHRAIARHFQLYIQQLSTVSSQIVNSSLFMLWQNTYCGA